MSDDKATIRICPQCWGGGLVPHAKWCQEQVPLVSVVPNPPISFEDYDEDIEEFLIQEEIRRSRGRATP